MITIEVSQRQWFHDILKSDHADDILPFTRSDAHVVMTKEKVDLIRNWLINSNELEPQMQSLVYLLEIKTTVFSFYFII